MLRNVLPSALAPVPLWPVLASLYSEEFLLTEGSPAFLIISILLFSLAESLMCLGKIASERGRGREIEREEGEPGMPLSDFHSWTWGRLPFPLFLSVRAQQPEISFKVVLSLTEVSLGQQPPQLPMNLGATVMWHT